jgi:hypothetical protein
MSSNNFESKKKELLNLLKKISDRMIFPMSFYNLLKNNENSMLIEFSKKIKNYNKSLTKLKILELELKELDSFGHIINSYFSWKTSVKWYIATYNKCMMEVNSFLVINPFPDKKNINKTKSFENVLKKFNIIDNEISSYIKLIKVGKNIYYKFESYVSRPNGSNDKYILSPDLIRSEFPKMHNILFTKNNNNLNNNNLNNNNLNKKKKSLVLTNTQSKLLSEFNVLIENI